MPPSKKTATPPYPPSGEGNSTANTARWKGENPTGVGRTTGPGAKKRQPIVGVAEAASSATACKNERPAGAAAPGADAKERQPIAGSEHGGSSGNRENTTRTSKKSKRETGASRSERKAPGSGSRKHVEDTAEEVSTTRH